MISWRLRLPKGSTVDDVLDHWEAIAEEKLREVVTAMLMNGYDHDAIDVFLEEQTAERAALWPQLREQLVEFLASDRSEERTS